jgi:ferrous iron transport protein A
MHSQEMSAIPLTDLEVGMSGELTKTSESDAPQRLLELGFVPGTTVTMVRIGALGDPIEVELRGYRLCLRRRDLAGVHVVMQENER